ncbi:RRM domain-containing protein [Trichonephila inaurata madagascariensis]|uniref:RRM domain-containing protein n=1 Tax=Trichonephila inaurata madagascariensis TaxID=2747483 RepID=A0A8X6X4P0_9ARAC|nr:RRM domain-containing protein [Trichonephila inaurata madagascariensis]
MAAPRTKLFVGHLPDGCSNQELQNLFEKYGTVKECDVINKYGFVHMSTPEEAEDAIKALNNCDFKGSSLSVEHSKSKLHPEPGAPGRAKGVMFRGGRSGGYGGPGGYQRGGYSNGYQRYDGPLFGVRDRNDDYYEDRYGGGSISSRMRHYPMPYDRPTMGMSRDDYGYRSSPYSVPSRDPYARSPALSPRDMYERRSSMYQSSSDFLYSRRSPPQIPPSSSRSYYGNSFEDPAPIQSHLPPSSDWSYQSAPIQSHLPPSPDWTYQSSRVPPAASRRHYY